MLSKQQLVIQEAIEKVKKAEVAGEKKGEIEAQKLIKKVQNQSLEQSQADVAQLQKKFLMTSTQVKSIIDNFQKVHSDIQSLKSEYTQQLESNVSGNSTTSLGSNGLLQLSAKVQMVQKSGLELQLQSKQQEIKNMMDELNQIKDVIPDSGLVKQIDETSKVGMMDLIQIDNQLNLPTHWVKYWKL